MIVRLERDRKKRESIHVLKPAYELQMIEVLNIEAAHAQLS